MVGLKKNESEKRVPLAKGLVYAPVRRPRTVQPAGTEPTPPTSSAAQRKSQRLTSSEASELIGMISDPARFRQIRDLMSNGKVTRFAELLRVLKGV